MEKSCRRRDISPKALVSIFLLGQHFRLCVPPLRHVLEKIASENRPRGGEIMSLGLVAEAALRLTPPKAPDCRLLGCLFSCSIFI